MDNAVYSLFDDEEETEIKDIPNTITLIDSDSIEHKYEYKYKVPVNGVLFIITKCLDKDLPENTHVIFQVFDEEIVPVRNNEVIFQVESYLKLISAINSGTPLLLKNEYGESFQYNIFDEMQIDNKKLFISALVSRLSDLQEEEQPKPSDFNINPKELTEETILNMQQEISERQKMEIIEGMEDTLPLLTNIEKTKKSEEKFSPVRFGEEIDIPEPSELDILLFEKDSKENYNIIKDEILINSVKEKFLQAIEISETKLPELQEIMTEQTPGEVVVIKDKKNNFLECTTVGRLFIEKREYIFLSPTAEPERAIATYLDKNNELVIVHDQNELKKIHESFKKNRR